MKWYSDRMKRILVFGLLLGCGVILIGFVPMGTRYANDARRLQIYVVIKDIRIALETFNVEYGHFPGQPVTSQSTDIRLLSTGPLIDCLMGQNTAWNRKEIKFIDLPTARNGKFGYVPAEGSNPCRLVDIWGNPYVILLDTNDDSKVSNPDIRNSDPSISQSKASPPSDFLPVKVAIYSFGKDGIEGTADDIVSWRSTRGSRAVLSTTWLVVIALTLLGFVVLIVLHMRTARAKNLTPPPQNSPSPSVPRRP